MYVRMQSVAACALAVTAAALATACTADQHVAGLDVSRTAAAAPATPSASLDISGGTPTPMITTRLAAGKCMDIAGGTAVAPPPGAPVQIWTCHGGANQQLVLQPSGMITAYNGARCMDVWGARGNNGDAIVAWPCHGGSNQRWTLTAAGELRSAINGKCLDVTGARSQNGTRLTIWTCSGSANQGWVVRSAAQRATSSPSGVPVYPGDNIQAKVDANPAGTTFVFRAGTYVQQTVVPKSGDAFVGDSGAVLDGGGAAQYAFWLGDATPYPSNVRIQGLEIRGYNPPQAFAPVRAGGHLPADGSRGWTVVGNYIHHNAMGGVRVGHLTTVRDNRIFYNGMSGVMGVGDSIVVENNELAYNNYQRTVDPAWGGAGMKLTETRWAVIRGNFAHHNTGAGLWTDINNIYTLYENNRVEDNTHAGIFHEISYQALIRNNQVARNGFGSQGWLFGAGILISESPDVEVTGNTVADNAVGIAGKQQVRGEPAEYGPHSLERLWVHGNTVTLSAPHAGAMNVLAGIGQDVPDGTSYYMARGNRFDANVYVAPTGLADPFHWNDALRDWGTWRAYGQEPSGTFTTR
ncbi:hypothetical protein tb265_25830 [Gemmatimonadetes bacterium T265]|nr:hypothetical protein tb265_25830 [Gemmatimonadetes bacterium T265]